MIFLSVYLLFKMCAILVFLFRCSSFIFIFYSCTVFHFTNISHSISSTLMLFYFLAMPPDWWDLGSLPRDCTRTAAVKVWNSNHLATRELPSVILLMIISVSSFCCCEHPSTCLLLPHISIWVGQMCRSRIDGSEDVQVLNYN